MKEKKKMGRPTDSLKDVRLTIRFDEDTFNILDEYCRENGFTKAEAIRIAVKGLKKQAGDM